MTTKFDHIKLGRAFRPHVLSELKAHPGWARYMAVKGWTKRSSTITGEDIRQACDNLGFDLNAAFVAFFSQPGAPAAAQPNIDRAMDAARKHNDEEEREMDSETPATPAAPPPPPVEALDAVEGFEGRDAETLIAEALAPASAHMTPHLAQMMPDLIRPFVEAAARGPRIVTKTIIKNVEGGEMVSSAAPVVNLLRKSMLYTAFGMPKSAAPQAYRYAFENVCVAVCDYADAPAIDPAYVWNVEALAQLAAADATGMNAWAYGHAGTGKTEGLRQYAARLGRPFVRIPIDRTTEPQEIIGQEMPRRGGGMEWRDGKLTRAFRVPHCVILIDEPTLLRSGSLAVFQTALDTREIHLPTGEVVRAADGVFIVAADNTAGCGDDSGRYVDTAAVNVAFMDRFAFRIEFSFLPASSEIAMLANHTGIAPECARLMVDYASLTRNNADAGKLTMGLTPRRLLCWAKAVRVGMPSAKAFQSCIVASASPEDRETILMLEAQSLRSQHATIDGIARGTIDPNAPDAHAQGAVSAAGLRFPDDNDTL
jgi:cobaltochelatase CobS